MKIFVVGSSRHLTEQEHDQLTAFQEFCKALGKTLAEKRWTVLVGSVDKGTADHWLLRGMEYAAATGKTIDAYIYRNEAVDVSMFKGFQLKPLVKFPSMTAAHISAISAADVVVVVGGHKKTPGAAWAGIALGKPVLLLRQFGGAGADLWKDLQATYAEALKDEDYNGLSDMHCGMPTLCGHTVVACETLLGKAKEKTRSAKMIILCTAIALVLGFGGFLLATGNPALSWKVFVVTIASVISGWMLAQLINQEKQRMVLTLPLAVMLSLVIVATIAIGSKVFGEFIKVEELKRDPSRLYIPLFAASLLSGFGTKPALQWWLKELGRKNEWGPSSLDEK